MLSSQPEADTDAQSTPALTSESQSSRQTPAQRAPIEPSVQTTPKWTASHSVESSVESTGRTEPVRDIAAEDAQASAAYQERIAENIVHLEQSANAARAAGQAQRAALMERRIEGLKRRAAEAEP